MARPPIGRRIEIYLIGPHDRICPAPRLYAAGII